MAWPINPRPAKSLVRLKDQLDEKYPGWLNLGMLGDASHEAVLSDHNPNDQGVVTALDIGPGGGLDIHELAEDLRQNRHPDLKYIISNSRIALAESGWAWAYYDGIDPHDTHIHISVGRGPDGQSRQPYDDTNDWNIIGEAMEPPIGYSTANQIHQDLTGKNWDQGAWQATTAGKLTFSETYSLIANSQARKDYVNHIATVEKQAATSKVKPYSGSQLFVEAK